MKHLFEIILAIALSVVIGTSAKAQWGDKKVSGNGDLISKTVSVSNYDQLKVIGSMDVELKAGAMGSVQVTTDSNLHEYIEIKNDGSMLIVRIRDNHSLKASKGIQVEVPYRSMERIQLIGSGDIKSNDRIKEDALELQLVGSGDIVLKVDVGQLDVNLNGSGDMDLEGSAKRLEVKVTGSGDFNGKNVNATDAEAYVAGSGDIELTAAQSLKARVNGSGSVHYQGKPATTDNKVRGSGSIKSM